MKPDLADPAARAAYRRELRRVAIPWRVFGFALILAGVLLMVGSGRDLAGLAGSAEGRASFLLLALGWALLIVAIVKRTRYHRARMAED